MKAANAFPKPYPSFILTLLILAALALAAVIWSQHAANGHVGQYNAPAIWQLYENRTCKPMLYYACPSTNKSLLICGIDQQRDLYGGIWIGMQDGTPRIITGYAARWSYWSRKIQTECNLPLAAFP